METDIVDNYIVNVDLCNTWIEDINTIGEEFNKRISEISNTLADEKEYITKRITVQEDLDNKIRHLNKQLFLTVDKGTILKLNIRGKRIEVPQFNLCQIEGSLLTKMFLNPEELNKSEDGSIFVDFNPKHFMWLVDYLGMLKLGRRIKLPSLEEDEKEIFMAMCEHLGVFSEDSQESLTRYEDRVKLGDKWSSNSFFVGCMKLNRGGYIRMIMWRIQSNNKSGFIGLVNDRSSGFGWLIEDGDVCRSDSKQKVGVHNNERITILADMEDEKLYLMGKDIIDHRRIFMTEDETFTLCTSFNYGVNVAKIEKVDSQIVVENYENDEKFIW